MAELIEQTAVKKTKDAGSVKKISPAQQRKKQAVRQQWVRGIIQLFFFITMPSAFVAGFSGIKYIFTQIGMGNTLGLNSFVKILIGLCLFTVLFGRYFCGYVCAFGFFGDLIYRISGLVQKKIFRRKQVLSLPGAAVNAAQKVKYGILLVIVILCSMGIYSRLSGFSPWDVFSRATAGKFSFDGYTLGAILMVGIMIGMALQERFFCQFLCPMGAAFALLPVFPAAVLKREESNCIKKCTACTKKCPLKLRLEAGGSRSGECIRCGQCNYACARGDIHSAGKLTGNEIWLVLGKGILFFGMGILLGLSRF